MKIKITFFLLAVSYGGFSQEYSREFLLRKAESCNMKICNQLLQDNPNDTVVLFYIAACRCNAKDPYYSKDTCFRESLADYDRILLMDSMSERALYNKYITIIEMIKACYISDEDAKILRYSKSTLTFQETQQLLADAKKYLNKSYHCAKQHNNKSFNQDGLMDKNWKIDEWIETVNKGGSIH
jgi:hypothetical protein